MKFLFVCFLLCSGFLFSQKSPEAYSFQKIRNQKTSYVKSGSSLHVQMKDSSDHSRSGNLISMNDSVLVFDMYTESISVSTDDYDFNSDYYYTDGKTTELRLSDIDYVYRERAIRNFPPIFTVFSLIAATVVSPILAIDKNSPNNFNTQRYTTLLKGSAILIGTGITMQIILGHNSDYRFRLKPALSY